MAARLIVATFDLDRPLSACRCLPSRSACRVLPCPSKPHLGTRESSRASTLRPRGSPASRNQFGRLPYHSEIEEEGFIGRDMRRVVAVPARDEASFIVPCLAALDGQTAERFDDIVLLVNNSSDATTDLARSVELHPSTRLHVLERRLTAEHANAGTARRLAMDAAAAIAGSDGVLLTTDADSLVDPTGSPRTSPACGQVPTSSPVGSSSTRWTGAPSPQRLHEDDARECGLRRAVRRDTRPPRPGPGPTRCPDTRTTRGRASPSRPLPSRDAAAVPRRAVRRGPGADRGAASSGRTLRGTHPRST